MTTAAMLAGAPARVLGSPFFAGSPGYRVYRSMPDRATCAALLAEAVSQYPEASHQECSEDDLADGRGGRPCRRLLTAQGSDAQDAIYRSAWLTGLLSRECALAVEPSGNRGSYSYYVRPGDFLDLHLDVDACDLTVITCLSDDSPPSDPGGALVLYPSRVGEPLSAVRERPRDGAEFVKLRPSETIVLFGGLLPHRLLPVADGQQRIVSVLCYRVCV